MKKIRLSFALLLLLAACSSDKSSENTDTSETITSSELNTDWDNHPTLPKAFARDAALESEMLEAAKNFVDSKYEPVHIIINSNRWVEEQDRNGNITNRHRIAIAVMKGEDGKCYYQHLIFQQDYLNNSGEYQNAKITDSYKPKETTCS